jgi:hypothetical protein
MNKVVVFLLLSLGHYSNAQVAFYFKPNFSFKICKGNSNVKLQDNIPFAPNPYFQLYNYGMYFSKNLNLGLNVGVNLKKNHFFEIGISTDHTGTATSVLTHNVPFFDSTSTQLNQWNNYNFQRFNYPYLRLSLEYQNQIFTTKNKVLSLKIILGSGLLFNQNVNIKKGKIATYTNNAFEIGEIKPGIFITEHIITGTASKRLSPYISIGIGADLYTMKRKYLFSFDLNYLIGTYIMIYQRHEISVFDNNQKTVYTYNMNSRGTGIYFQLSRRLQFYKRQSTVVKGL